MTPISALLAASIAAAPVAPEGDPSIDSLFLPSYQSYQKVAPAAPGQAPGQVQAQAAPTPAPALDAPLMGSMPPTPDVNPAPVARPAASSVPSAASIGAPARALMPARPAAFDPMTSPMMPPRPEVNPAQVQAPTSASGLDYPRIGDSARGGLAPAQAPMLAPMPSMSEGYDPASAPASAFEELNPAEPPAPSRPPQSAGPVGNPRPQVMSIPAVNGAYRPAPVPAQAPAQGRPGQAAPRRGWFSKGQAAADDRSEMEVLDQQARDNYLRISQSPLSAYKIPEASLSPTQTASRLPGTDRNRDKARADASLVARLRKPAEQVPPGRPRVLPSATDGTESLMASTGVSGTYPGRGMPGTADPSAMSASATSTIPSDAPDEAFLPSHMAPRYSAAPTSASTGPARLGLAAPASASATSASIAGRRDLDDPLRKVQAGLSDYGQLTRP